jgi:CreA protein
VLSEELKRRLAKETEDGGVKVFKERTSPIFKTMQVTRMYDAQRNTLIYLEWSDKLVEGSPKSSLSVVVMSPWDQRS